MLSIAKNRYPWINSDLIESVLKSSTSVATNVIEFHLHDAVGKGENYTSHLVRISVKYSEGNDLSPKQTSFVIKTTLAKEIHEMLEKVFLFAKEVAFYRDILPKFNQYTKLIDPEYKCSPRQTSFVIKTTLAKEIHEMLEKVFLFAKEVAFYRDILPKFNQYTKLIDPEYKCSPRCLKVNEDPLYFVFEDLREDNYRNMDRHIGFNFEANEMLLLKLAKFHAIGCMVYEQNPELFVHHRKNMVNPESKVIMEAFTTGMRQVLEKCVHWPGYEHYSVKLANLVEVILERISATFEHDPNTFNTLTHGDLWVNNIMYKFDDTNNPVDVLMVDYQIGCYGSPVIDLSYLLYTSSSNEMYEEDWDRLIQIYHTELVKSLKAVNYKKSIPTLTEIHIEFLKRSIYSVMVALAVIGPRHMINTSMADMESFLKDPEAIKKIHAEIYQQPEVVERIKYLLDYFDRKGFLDI